MDFKQVQEIIKDFEKSNLTNLEIELEDFKLKLNKNEWVQAEPVHNNIKKDVVIDEEIEEQNGTVVKSPLVGTYYAAPSPKDDNFVKLGQKVSKGDTICIIEAMKIMNEIIAPTDGVIESIQIKNGEPVGFDQVIMSIV